jgi:outer membrane receptor protein involved in Fe transport
MFSNSKLRTAVRLGLGMGAGAIAVGYSPGALAQDTGAKADEVLEEIVTTGSRIKRADIESASPVTVLQREDIVNTGLTDVGNIIQTMPSMSGSPIGTTTNNGGNGSVQVDLRGMGVDRTLTLVNGHRVVDGGDYQTIPSNMIERVEILKDGASAVYGADAVAGVVNIITRKNFDGVELNAQTSDWFNTDAGRQDVVGLVVGKTFDDGNFVFGAEFVDQQEAYQSDTPWKFMQDSYYIYPEGCEKHPTLPYDGTPSGGCYPIGSSAIPQGRWNLLGGSRYLVGTVASAPYEAGIPILHDGRNYNYAPVNYIQTPYKRTNIFAEANFAVTDSVNFALEFRGNNRSSAQELAPTPYFSITDPAYDGFFDDGSGVLQAYHGVSDQNYYLRQAIDNYNAANGTALAYVPAVDVRRRMFEQPRRFTQSIDQYEFNAAFDGTFNDIDWDVYVNKGYRSRQDQDFGQYAGARLALAMGPSADLDGDGMPECYGDTTDPNTLITGCVPMNFFGGGEVVRATGQPTASSVTQDMLDYVSFTLNDSFLTEQNLAGFGLSGSGFDLPGGPLGWAAGVDYWKQEYTYTSDSGKSSSAVSGNKSSPTHGILTNKSVYAEFLAPFFDNGSQALNLKLGLRYDDWSAFEGDSTYQVGLEFHAIEDLKFRATHGTVFRAPTISDLYAGAFDNFPTFSDPCAPANIANSPGCSQTAPGDEPQLLARQGGNPNLTPETGDTTTVGVVWTPKWGDSDLTATVDYWVIDLKDGISSLGVQYILDDCYVNQNAQSCALVFRRPGDYGIDHVLDGPLNVSKQGAKGIDTELRWNMDSNVGQWQAAILWSHLLERTKTPYAGAPEQDLSGRYSDPTAQDGGAYAADKMNFSLQWMRNDLSIGYKGNYISGLDADTFCNCNSDGDPSNNGPDGLTYTQKISSFLYHDLYASYTWQGLNVAVGITNVTDEEPPFMDVGFNATTDPPTYRMFGRGYYFRATYTF